MCRAAICRWNGNCQKKYRRVPLYQGWPNTMRCTYTKWAWPNISWTIRRWRRCCHCMDAQRAASRTDGGWCLPKPHRKRTFLCVAIWCWPLGRRIWPIGLVCPTRIIDRGWSTIWRNWKMPWSSCRNKNDQVSVWTHYVPAMIVNSI